MTEIIKIKVTPKSTVKGKMDVRFPANIQTENFLTVTRANGTYTFSIDYTVLTPGPISDPTTAIIAILDQTAGVYKKVSLSSLLTSGLDADLQAIGALTGTGILARTADGTWALRTLTAPAAGITITNPAGVAGNPTLVLANDLAAVEGLAANGIATRTATDTWTVRTITAGASIGVTNGDGVAGNPTIAVTDAELVALAGLTSAADQVPYFTGSGTAALASFPTFGRSIAAAASQAAARTVLALTPGTDIQAFDSDLAALAANASTGLWSVTGTGTGSVRTITGPAAGITVTNGGGVAGNPTLALANDLAALEGLSSTGIARRTGTDAWSVGTAVANSELATMNAFTLKGNNTSGAATPTDVDISLLTSKASPASTDLVMISDQAASGAWKKVTISSLASAGSVASIAGNTGAFTLAGGITNSTNVIQIDGTFEARNRLINPTGQINQSGIGSQTDATYDFDQWLTLTQTAAVTVSQLTNVENSTPFMMRSLQAQASAQRFGRIQWIENANVADLRGQSVVISARVRMSASTTLRYAIIEWTGTADTITKDIVLDWTNATFTAGNFFTTTSTTITATGSTALTANTLATISLAGTVGSSMTNMAVFFWTDSTQAQNVTLDIGKVQLEAGVSPSNFAPRPLQVDLLLCQRYWRATAVGAGMAFASTDASIVVPHVGMRVAPSVSVTAAIQLTDIAFTNPIQSSANVTGAGNNPDAGAYNMSNFTGLTSGRYYTFYQNPATPIRLNARL